MSEARAPTWIALLRAIGPATHAKMSMAALRAGCEASGLRDVRTLLATGNIVFTSERAETDVQGIVAGVLAGHGLSNAVILRRPEDLAALLSASPFPNAARDRPARLLALCLAGPPDAAGLERLQSRDGPERLAGLGRDVVIDYAGGVGTSRLTSAMLERHLGVTGTARNWNTLTRLVHETSGAASNAEAHQWS